MKTTLATILLVLVSGSLAGQDPPRIADNSFLIEEAYNQEAGVVQHVSTLTLARGDNWAYTFTQEWPFRGQRNQLSYTIPLEHRGGPAGSLTKLGDIALNYRLQAVNQPNGVAVSPRVSVLIPTGDDAVGFGRGGVGFQANLPISVLVAPRLVTHFNAGFTITPSASNGVGDRATTADLNAGASAIFLVSPTLNLMLETGWFREDDVAGQGEAFGNDTFFVSPGLRYAINTRGGLQIVPGIAYTMHVISGPDENLVFIYLSFEHAFRRISAE